MDSALVGTGLHSSITRKVRKGCLVFCLHHLLQLLGAFHSSGDHASLIPPRVVEMPSTIWASNLRLLSGFLIL